MIAVNVEREEIDRPAETVIANQPIHPIGRDPAAHSVALLDVGSGGFFEYPIGHISDVTAIDLFVDPSFGPRYPRLEWHQLSALEMTFDKRFDTVIAINTLHHLVGRAVEQTYANLREFT